MRPAGGDLPVVCVGPNPQCSDGDTILYKKKRLSDEMLSRGPDSLWSLNIP